MPKKIIILIAALTFFSGLNAAFLTVNNQPQSSGRGNMASSSEISRLSPFNPAGNLQFCANYNIPFGLNELARQNIDAALPLFERSLIISLENFGNPVYRENSIFAAYPLYKSNQISLVPALQYNYLSCVEKNYSTAGAGISALLIPVPQVEIISSISNAFSTSFNGETPEADYQLSCRYKTAENSSFYLGVEKDQNTPAVVKCGAEITLLEKISLEAGYNFEPALYTAGFSFLLGNWNFAYAFNYHDQLGFSQLAGLSFELK